MSEVFISYSREDLDFVARLRQLLEAADLSVWVDIDGLYAGEEFWPEVKKAIDAALAVIFIITPDSIASKFCGKELEHAVDEQKRIVPILCREIDSKNLHPELSKRQWVFFRNSDDPDVALEALLSAVRADWMQLRQQARLLVHAREWQTKNCDTSLLLRGRDLREAELWLVESEDRENGPASLHTEFILASRRAAKQRFMRLAGSAAAALIVIVIESWFALSLRVASLNNLSLDNLSRNQPQGAVDKLERATALCAYFASLFNGCGDANLNLGRAYLDVGKYSEALTQLSGVIVVVENSNADDSEAIDYRTTAYQNRAFANIMQAELLDHDEPQPQDQYAHAQTDLD